MGEFNVDAAKWTLMRPIDEAKTECTAGSECCFPQKNGRPGIAFGYWMINSINVRACSRKCAERIVKHLAERFK